MPDSSALNEPINTTETTETTVVWETWQQERLVLLRLRHDYSSVATLEQREMQAVDGRSACQACAFAGEHGLPDTYVFEGIHHDSVREWTRWARWPFPHARDCPRQEGSA